MIWVSINLPLLNTLMLSLELYNELIVCFLLLTGAFFSSFFFKISAKVPNYKNVFILFYYLFMQYYNQLFDQSSFTCQIS